MTFDVSMKLAFELCHDRRAMVFCPQDGVNLDSRERVRHIDPPFNIVA
jgi:hypothetical protein